MHKEITITFASIREISAIYYALLQNGYTYYQIDRNEEHVFNIRKYTESNRRYKYFEEVEQNTCEVYPFWPRAAILETAAFYVDQDHNGFIGFNAFQEKIMNAGNISDRERDQNLWNWIAEYPNALKEVMGEQGFLCYYEFEQAWVQREFERHQADVMRLQNLLKHKIFESITGIEHIQVVINPIKCVYSADYHVVDTKFIYSSGCFRFDSVIHEMVHLVIHPLIEKYKDAILRIKNQDFEIDASYYLDGDDMGRMNAFEEAVVRNLTKKIVDHEEVERAEDIIVQMIRLAEENIE